MSALGWVQALELPYTCFAPWNCVAKITPHLEAQAMSTLDIKQDTNIYRKLNKSLFYTTFRRTIVPLRY